MRRLSVSWESMTAYEKRQGLPGFGRFLEQQRIFVPRERKRRCRASN